MAGLLQVAKRSVVGCVLMLALTCMALVFAVTGARYLSNKDADVKRTNKVSQFLNSRNAWHTAGRSRFESIDHIRFEPTLHQPLDKVTYGYTNITLTPHNGTEKLRDVQFMQEYGAEWEPLAFVYNGPFNLSSRPWANVEATLKFQSPMATFSFDMALSKRISAPTSSWKVCYFQKQGAQIGAHSCLIHQRLDRLCVRVEYNATSGHYQLPAEGEIGCPSAAGMQTSYSSIRGGQRQAPGSMQMHQIRLTVRAADDPLFSAIALTEGALNFGMSHKDRLAVSWTFISVAIACVVGAFTLVGCMYAECGYFSVEDYYTMSPSTAAASPEKRAPQLDDAGNSVVISGKTLDRLARLNPSRPQAKCRSPVDTDRAEYEMDPR
eukprot:NODE_1623_length_1274_cov_174.032258_g1608_i0.p1 GENE.NODE_1623_length_1274_cov_174.032258_g1608_i0~~NODE_1623_length_1274_cov_174.032258_g1608_i0.p1  ORF type:complete len:409 (-),score=54.67 NODE_1623_length_1274_cov_174.032258_g1608_i0:48-1184(-)